MASEFPLPPSHHLSINLVIGFDEKSMALLTAVAKALSADGAKLDKLVKNTETIMASIDDIASDVAAETTAIGGVSTLIQGLRDQIAAQGIPADVQAKIDSVFAQVESNKAALAAALTANVPPAPAPAAGT